MLKWWCLNVYLYFEWTHRRCWPRLLIDFNFVPHSSIIAAISTSRFACGRHIENDRQSHILLNQSVKWSKSGCGGKDQSGLSLCDIYKITETSDRRVYLQYSIATAWTNRLESKQPFYHSHGIHRVPIHPDQRPFAHICAQNQICMQFDRFILVERDFIQF